MSSCDLWVINKNMMTMFNLGLQNSNLQNSKWHVTAVMFVFCSLWLQIPNKFHLIDHASCPLCRHIRNLLLLLLLLMEDTVSLFNPVGFVKNNWQLKAGSEKWSEGKMKDKKNYIFLKPDLFPFFFSKIIASPLAWENKTSFTWNTQTAFKSPPAAGWFLHGSSSVVKQNQLISPKVIRTERLSR